MENRKVLVVDDEPVINEIFEGMLKDEFSVKTAQSGREALSLASLFKPAVIALDAQMPYMDGFEVCKKLKADPQTKAIPVIMFSAFYTEKEHREKAVKSGACEYIVKGVIHSEILDAIRKYCR
jgi:CheY-like chemotaxis protein